MNPEPNRPQPPPLPGQLVNPNCGPWSFWLTLAWGLVCFLIVVVAQSIGAVIGIVYLQLNNIEFNLENVNTNGMVLSIAGILSLPAYLLGPILFVKLRKTLSIREYFHLYGTTVLNWILWTLGGVALVIGVGYLLKLLGAPEKDPWMVEIWESAGRNPLFIFTILIVAPIGEEWLFRGFLFKGWSEFNKTYAPWVAIGLTTLIWTLIHGQYNWHGLVHLAFVGVYLGVARWKTNSLLVPIWIHFVNNLMATLLMHYATNS